MEQPVELALPFPQMMLLHFSLYILKCFLQLDFNSWEEWCVYHFLTWQLHLADRNFLLKYLNWSLTSNTRKMSSNTSHHILYNSLTIFKLLTVIYSLGTCFWCIYRSVNSASEIYRSFTYLLAKHHLDWDFATKSYCSFMKLSTWYMKASLENLKHLVFPYGLFS